MEQQGFSSRQVCSITGLSARQLRYWQQTGLLSPSQHTPGGHARYSFTDLIALKSARRLLDAGVSLQRIRKCLHSLTRFLPTARIPLRELSLVVTGDVVLVLHAAGAFDALSGQEWVLPVADILQEIDALRTADKNDPQQWELSFGDTGEGEREGPYRLQQG
ncbi:MAG TPA: MerR family transcriptional regulator [Gammaproteobacteria bacterium]